MHAAEADLGRPGMQWLVALLTQQQRAALASRALATVQALRLLPPAEVRACPGCAHEARLQQRQQACSWATPACDAPCAEKRSGVGAGGDVLTPPINWQCPSQEAMAGMGIALHCVQVFIGGTNAGMKELQQVRGWKGLGWWGRAPGSAVQRMPGGVSMNEKGVAVQARYGIQG